MSTTIALPAVKQTGLISINANRGKIQVQWNADESGSVLFEDEDRRLARIKRQAEETSITCVSEPILDALLEERESLLIEQCRLKTFPLSLLSQNKLKAVERRITVLSEQIFALSRATPSVEDILAELREGKEELFACLDHLNKARGQKS